MTRPQACSKQDSNPVCPRTRTANHPYHHAKILLFVAASPLLNPQAGTLSHVSGTHSRSKPHPISRLSCT
ncbi:hypothetical protein MA16_Dca004810 [Dendrobium catenatum]|uniref:Uncharacterized protein n=1 Tax=Dendrobium catenatum TaxID=906689 RepID=A0A2I0WG15_9ASPA|nr:hypothetical protein MA16_Dca004810 [Dendrobium catenatum]